MIAIGIDYSMTSPAICTYDGTKAGFSFDKCTCYSLCDAKIDKIRKNISVKNHVEFTSQIDRFDKIAQWALSIIDEYDANDVVVGLEDYSMGSKGKVFHIAENTAVLKLRLHDRGFSLTTIPPTVIKKFATGKGTANKDVMWGRFLLDTKIDLKKELQPNRKLGSPTTDVIDAYYICKYMMEN